MKAQKPMIQVSHNYHYLQQQYMTGEEFIFSSKVLLRAGEHKIHSKRERIQLMSKNEKMILSILQMLL